MYQDEDTFPLPREIVGDGDLFLMKMHGTPPAIDMQVSDGDWLVVREQTTIDPGDVAAVQYEGELFLSPFDGVPDGGAVVGKVVSVIHRT